jgi:AMIN domain
MRRARQLAALLLLVPVAAAQNPTIVPTEVTGVVVSVQQGAEIRIELSIRGSGPEAKVIAAYPDSVVLDLPGAVYRGLPRRIPVNAGGVRAVRLWMQTEDPPLTRVLVEIDRTEQYLETFDGKGIVLRVGPVLEEASAKTTPSGVSSSGAASPAGRGSVSANAASALGGIFRRGPGKPSTSSNAKIRNGLPVPPDGVDAQTAQSSKTMQNPSPPNPPLPATDTVASSAPSADQSSPATGSAGATKPADTMIASSAVREPPDKVQPPSLEEGQPVTSAGSVPSPSAASLVALPVELPAAVSEPAKDPKNTPEAAPAPELPPAHVSQPAAIPGRSATSAPDVAAFSAVANPGMRTEFQVKYVDQDAAYLDGGRSSGLTEGMKLMVKNKRPAAATDGSVDPAGAIAELVVVGLAETSAVTEIRAPKRDVVAGDLAYLSSQDLQALVQQHALGATRKYPAVITFSEGGDALDEEARAFIPRPPMPSVNRASGRIGFDYSGTKSNDASQASSSSIGAVVRADFTRIGGTYWNLRGYWRGRVSSTSSASSPQTLQDLLNRTYHLALTYENPNSRWTVGAGRLYLPWAASLETIDGGYFGARMGHGVTTGIFGGSTPDPTSWNYSPNRHIGGAFLNEEVGSYDAVRFSSTAGFGKSFNTVQYSTTTSAGTTTASYQDNRPFAFFENSVSYRRTFSIFSALQADQPSANPAVAAPGAGISRSFLTVRVQPFSRIEFSANHTYFRDIPTFDPQLVSTGLLDKYLFQGFSGGVRVEVVKNIALYSDLGRSSRTGDAKTSLNQMYGITFLRIPKVLLHADAHYSRFISSFGSGTYRSFSLSRNLGESFHAELLGGDQSFTSSLAGNQNAKFLTTNMDTSLGALFFLQGGFTVYRGQLQNYNQWNLTLGYRFDSKWKHK